MRKFTLYLGLNDKDTKTQQVETVEAYKIVSNLLLKRFDGATIFNAQGIYKHDNGEIVTENTFRIELLEFGNSIFEQVKEVVSLLKEIFNQESVAVQIQDVTSDLW